MSINYQLYYDIYLMIVIHYYTKKKKKCIHNSQVIFKQKYLIINITA